ncbi:MAG: FecR domain-containing protein [Sandaracinaceae bacterium]
MTDDELDEALATYEVPEPPAGFVERVMAASEAGEPAVTVAPERRSRGRAVALGITAAAAAIAVGAGVLLSARPSQGELVAAERTEARLGSRGVAVAEPGARLSWTVDADTAEIEQPAGNVFFRAEPSERFVVRTPAGEVRVRGTCFRVEVVDMSVNPQLFVGAAAGALLASGVLVTVYEGEVEVENPHGSLSVSAGERAAMEPSAAPRRSDEPAGPAADPRASRGERVREVEALDDSRIDEMDPATLRARLRELSARGAEQAHEIDRLHGLLDDANLNADVRTGHFFPASQDELRQWAEACQLRVDQPPVMGIEPGRVGRHAQTLGLSDAESRAVQDAIDRVHESLTADLRALYIEATGDAAGAAHLSPDAMLAEIQDKASENERTSLLMNRIARERGGLEAGPSADAEQSTAERALRRYVRVGDEFQELLAGSLGPERAYELRAADGGWPWAHSIFSGCPDE